MCSLASSLLRYLTRFLSTSSSFILPASFRITAPIQPLPPPLTRCHHRYHRCILQTLLFVLESVVSIILQQYHVVHLPFSLLHRITSLVVHIFASQYRPSRLLSLSTSSAQALGTLLPSHPLLPSTSLSLYLLYLWDALLNHSALTAAVGSSSFAALGHNPSPLSWISVAGQHQATSPLV